MKRMVSSRALFFLGFLTIIAANAVLLAHVASNRSGPDIAVIKLTGREFKPAYPIHDENSGMSLDLQWRTLGKNEETYDYNYHYDPPAWFDEDKLKSMGFSINRPKDFTRRYTYEIPRKAFIVLEYGGEPYQEALRRTAEQVETAQAACDANSGDEKLKTELKMAQHRLDDEQTSASRLFAVDAGLDPKLLREKYKDPARFIIAPGIVEQRWNDEKTKPVTCGYIARMCVENIHVPLEFRKEFEGVPAKEKSGRNQSPRYTVALAYGSRFEPWINGVERITDKDRP